jgi:DNA-binding IclR family transcriptional regulator
MPTGRKDTMGPAASERDRRRERILRIVDQRSGKESLTVHRIAALTGIPAGSVDRYISHLVLEGRLVRAYRRRGVVSMDYAKREWQKERRRQSRRQRRS